MKKDYFINKKPTAYYSGLGGLEVYGIEYGINDYMYYTTGAWNGKLSYHKTMIYYTSDGAYVMQRGYKVNLNECIRI